MKQYFSIFALAARSTINKIIGIILLMATAEIALFTFTLKNMTETSPLLLEEVFSQSLISIACATSFISICVILCIFGCNRSRSQSSYLINRLSIKEETAVTIWAIYNILCFIIFWAIQIVIALFLSQMYLNYINPLYYGSHTVYLAFYRNEFLHSLLPLEEYSRYIRNIMLILGLGLSCACFSLKQRRNQRGLSAIVLAIITVVFFSQEIGNFGSDLFLSLIALIVASRSVYYIWWGDKNEI